MHNNKCPHCGSDNIDSHDINIEHNEVHEFCHCLDCDGFIWTNVYKLEEQRA